MKDFEQCTPNEFYEVFNQWSVHNRDQDRAEWERVRVMAMFFVQPYMKGKTSAHDVLPLPWDDEHEDVEANSSVSKEEMDRRFEEAKKKFDMK